MFDALFPDENIILKIPAERRTYDREHLFLAILGAVLMYVVLLAVGNPYPWTGIVGAFIAIFIRWFYVASEAMGVVWTLTDKRLYGPSERSIPLASIKTVRSLFSAVQVITRTGDKYMLKYLADPEGTVNAILTARDRRMA